MSTVAYSWVLKQGSYDLSYSSNSFLCCWLWAWRWKSTCTRHELHWYRVKPPPLYWEWIWNELTEYSVYQTCWSNMWRYLRISQKWIAWKISESRIWTQNVLNTSHMLLSLSHLDPSSAHLTGVLVVRASNQSWFKYQLDPSVDLFLTLLIFMTPTVANST